MKNRDKITSITKNFTKIPNRIFYMKLSPIAIVTYTALCFYSEDFNPTLGNIAKLLGVHRNTICKVLKELETSGVIRKISQGYLFRNEISETRKRGEQSIYEFVPVSEWIDVK